MRCFSDYYNGKMQSQKILLEKLESAGFEQNDKRILTTKAVGLPITVYLLLLREAIDRLENEQKQLIDDHRVIETVNTERVESDFELLIKDSSAEFRKNTQAWNLNSVWYQPETPMVSGCPVYEMTNVLVPKQNDGIDLRSIYETKSPDIEIYKSVIKIKPETEKQRPMIEVYKQVFNIVEYFYALSQRINSEVDLYNQKLKSTIQKGKISGEFESNCTRRGALIHEGNMALSIDPTNSVLYIQGKELIQTVNLGFEEAIQHIDLRYQEMLSKFPS